MSKVQPEVAVYSVSKEEKRALVSAGHEKCSILLFSGVFWIDLPLKYIS